MIFKFFKISKIILFLLLILNINNVSSEGINDCIKKAVNSNINFFLLIKVCTESKNSFGYFK